MDEMVKGAFASLRHVHEFVADGGSVLMRDTPPGGPRWDFSELLRISSLSSGHMRAFMVKKQSELKEYAKRTTNGARLTWQELRRALARSKGAHAASIEPRTSASTIPTKFFNSERSSGILLIVCTAISLLLSELLSLLGSDYADGVANAGWRSQPGALINDALMAIFFLLIGLELERELYSGELSNIRNALLPMFRGLRRHCCAGTRFTSYLTRGRRRKPASGFQMATDIAFALGVLALLGNRVPASLKTFVVAFAVIDDLSACCHHCGVLYRAISGWGIFARPWSLAALLCGLNRLLRVMSLAPYLLGGALVWLLMLKSGVTQRSLG